MQFRQESMRLSSRNYRQYLHSPPEGPQTISPPAGFQESKGKIFFSRNAAPWLISTLSGFLILEVFLEFNAEFLPLGISFPFGFLLFWALFYSYRNPLEINATPAQSPPAPARPDISEKKPFSPEPILLPDDIQSALIVLGLKNCRNWGVIHRRYRELAKQVHPDLNPELTAAENRFILYDRAYRKLLAVKKIYFSVKS